MNDVKFINEVDGMGNPSGGAVTSIGMVINWQNGPSGRGVDRKPPNGAFVEDVITAALTRLRFFQGTKFACQDNEEAIVHLEEAMHSLLIRTRDRENRKVEGTYQQ